MRRLLPRQRRLAVASLLLLLLDMPAASPLTSTSLICEKFDVSCTGPDCPNQEHCVQPQEGQQQACMAVYRNASAGFEMHTKGCFSFQTSGGLCQDTAFCANDPVYNKKDTVFCCCTRPMCNAQLKWIQPAGNAPTTQAPLPSTAAPPAVDNGLLTVLLILLPICLAGVLVVLAYFAYRRYKLNRYLCKARTAAQSDQLTNGFMGIKTGNNPPGQLRNIRLLEIAAQGRFGQVWRAQMGDQIAAVKVFPQQDADSWVQEQDIYSINGMKQHANVLHFIAAEVRGCGPTTEYWLITTFHNRGSLTDYLKRHELTVAEALHVSIGMLRGLTFLHEEILMADGTVRKPTIVHRDFKSRNVLLHDDMTACIADFGLALKCEHGRTPQDTHGQVGTRRYMSPEVLEGATEFSAFAFRQIDVYAAALCLWEIVSRTQIDVNFPVSDYRLPFEAEVGAHPSLGDMQDVVVTNKQRPVIQQHWFASQQLCVVCKTIEEMWDTEPEARITGGCAFERLAALQGAAMIDTLYLTHEQHYGNKALPMASNPAHLFISGLPPPSYEQLAIEHNNRPPQPQPQADEEEGQNLLHHNSADTTNTTEASAASDTP